MTCTVCRKHPPREGYKLCPRCTARKLASVRRHRAKLRRSTLCTHCGRHPKRAGHTTCPRCAEAARRATTQRKAARVAAGLCLKCGGARDADPAECAVCRARRVATQQRRKARKALRGECAECPARATRGVLCDDCHTRRVQRERPTPKRVVHCGRCGGVRHNETTCPAAEPVGAMLARRAA